MPMLRDPITQSDHVRGDPRIAAVTLVEYGDYQCPYCGLAQPVVQRLLQHYGEEVPFVFRNFPLTQIHPWAESAAETAEFAGDHAMFWRMHDALYENQDKLGLPLFFALARVFLLPETDLHQALEGERYAAKVRSQYRGGVRSGVNGTPTFFINGRRHDGAFDYDSLRAAIDGELLATRVAPPATIETPMFRREAR